MKTMKVLGLAAVGAVLVLAAPVQRANAVSLATPAASSAVPQDARTATTEVRWGRGGHRRWGGWHRRGHWRR